MTEEEYKNLRNVEYTFIQIKSIEEMKKFVVNNANVMSVLGGNTRIASVAGGYNGINWYEGYEIVISNGKSASFTLEIDYANEIYVIFNKWDGGLKGRWFGFKYFKKKFTEMQCALYEENFDYFNNWKEHLLDLGD